MTRAKQELTEGVGRLACVFSCVCIYVCVGGEGGNRSVATAQSRTGRTIALPEATVQFAHGGKGHPRHGVGCLPILLIYPGTEQSRPLDGARGRPTQAIWPIILGGGMAGARETLRTSAGKMDRGDRTWCRRRTA